MRTVLKVLLATLMFAFPAWGTTVTLTGTVKNPVGGQLMTGSACFGLPVNAIDTSTNVALTSLPMCYPVTNGTFPAFATLIPNDVIQPTNTYYRTTFYDTSGQPVMYANYVVPTGGGTFNIGTAVPTAITTSNISFISPACLSCNNVFTGLNTFTQQLSVTVSTGTAPFAITSTTLVPNLNVQTINGVVVTGTPAAGQVLTANSATTGSFQALPATNGFKVECMNTTAVTVANTAALTPLQACTLAANEIGASQSFYVDAFGTVSNVGPPTLTLCLYIDAVSMGCPTITLSAVSGQTWSYRGYITGLTTGVTGTVTGSQAHYLISTPPLNFGKNASVCSTTNTAGATCSTVVTLNQTEPDTNYAASATCVGPTQFPFINGISKATGSVTVTLVNGTASEAQVSTCSELDVVVSGAGTTTPGTPVPSPATIDTTASHSIRLQVQWGTASASNTITSSTFTVTRIG